MVVPRCRGAEVGGVKMGRQGRLGWGWGGEEKRGIFCSEIWVFRDYEMHTNNNKNWKRVGRTRGRNGM